MSRTIASGRKRANPAKSQSRQALRRETVKKKDHIIDHTSALPFDNVKPQQAAALNKPDGCMRTGNLNEAKLLWPSPAIAKVARMLLNVTDASASTICQATKLPRSTVMRSLRKLVEYNALSSRPSLTNANTAMYGLTAEAKKTVERIGKATTPTSQSA